MRAALALAVAVVCAGCGSTTLDEHAFQKDAESLRSVAAESALLAAQIAEGEGTTPFARVHTEYLGKDAETLETTLRSARAERGLAAKRAAAARLAGQVADDIERLHEAPDDRMLAARLHADLLEAADAAERLAQ